MAPYFIHYLVPRREQSHGDRPLLEVLASLTWIQWALLRSGYVAPLLSSAQFIDLRIDLRRWLAWFADSLDFFSVSLSVTNLQRQFNKSEASDNVRSAYLPPHSLVLTVGCRLQL